MFSSLLGPRTRVYGLIGEGFVLVRPGCCNDGLDIDTQEVYLTIRSTVLPSIDWDQALALVPDSWSSQQLNIRHEFG